MASVGSPHRRNRGWHTDFFERVEHPGDAGEKVSQAVLGYVSLLDCTEESSEMPDA